MPSKPCVSCGSHKPIFARSGVCHACFAAQCASGERCDEAPVRCSAKGCDGWSVKKGMCDRHYRRMLDHGSTQKVRQVGARAERLHPEYKNWLWWRDKSCEMWSANFDAFLSAVGDRPTSRHWLERPNDAMPLGPDNFIWRAPLLDQSHDMSTTEGRREYQRARAMAQPGYWVGAALRQYGLTTERYAEMLEAQGGVCAICRKPETERSKSGAVKMMVVDHCHDRSMVRGLLCSRCNKVIGFANDDAQTLRLAADYVDRHRLASADLPSIADAPRALVRTLAAEGEPACEECLCAIVSRRSDARFCSKACNMRWHRREGSSSKDALLASGQICSIHDCGGISQSMCIARCASYEIRRPAVRSPHQERKCSVEGCDNKHLARDLCLHHYHAHRYEMRSGKTGSAPSEQNAGAPQ